MCCDLGILIYEEASAISDKASGNKHPTRKDWFSGTYAMDGLLQIPRQVLGGRPGGEPRPTLQPWESEIALCPWADLWNFSACLVPPVVGLHQQRSTAPTSAILATTWLPIDVCTRVDHLPWRDDSNLTEFDSPGSHLVANRKNGGQT